MAKPVPFHEALLKATAELEAANASAAAAADAAIKLAEATEKLAAATKDMTIPPNLTAKPEFKGSDISVTVSPTRLSDAVIEVFVRDAAEIGEVAAEIVAVAYPPAGPPRIVEGIVWVLLPRKIRDAILGDAEEAYWQTIKRYNSRTLATADYVKEAIFAVLGGIRMSVANFILKLLKRSS